MRANNDPKPADRNSAEQLYKDLAETKADVIVLSIGSYGGHGRDSN